MDQAKNFAKVTVTDGNYDSTSTSIVVASGQGARFPAAPFNVVWWNVTDYPDPADDPNVEVVRVTAISTDTLTVTRGQEGTGASEKNIASKTYQMILCLTAKVVNEDLVGDVFGSGPALLFFTEDNRTRWRSTSARYIEQSDVETEIQSIAVSIGDAEGEQNNGYLRIDDAAGYAALQNLDLATSQSQSATGPVGSVVGKLIIKDQSGTTLGYLPIYDSIT